MDSNFPSLLSELLHRPFRRMAYPFPETNCEEIAALLQLPDAILLRIIGHLESNSEPNLAILRRTHRIFWCLIRPEKVGDRSTREPRKIPATQLRSAQDSFPFLFPSGYFACFECLRVKPANKFADDVCVEAAKWGLKPQKRLCLDCGIVRGKYKADACVRGQGVVHRLCRRCGKFIANACSRKHQIYFRERDLCFAEHHVCFPNGRTLFLALLLTRIVVKLLRARLSRAQQQSLTNVILPPELAERFTRYLSANDMKLVRSGSGTLVGSGIAVGQSNNVAFSEFTGYVSAIGLFRQWVARGCR